jgi:hypothetical protein
MARLEGFASSSSKKKLSMAAFKELRQSRALLEEGTRLHEEGDTEGARHQLAAAVAASPDAVEARIALAQELWDCAGKSISEILAFWGISFGNYCRADWSECLQARKMI